MNQGIEMCTGDVIACFNDEFVSEDAASIMMKLLEDNSVVGVHADLVYANGNKVVKYWYMGQRKSLILRFFT